VVTAAVRHHDSTVDHHVGDVTRRRREHHGFHGRVATRSAHRIQVHRHEIRACPYFEPSGIGPPERVLSTGRRCVQEL